MMCALIHSAGNRAVRRGHFHLCRDWVQGGDGISVELSIDLPRSLEWAFRGKLIVSSLDFINPQLSGILNKTPHVLNQNFPASWYSPTVWVQCPCKRDLWGLATLSWQTGRPAFAKEEGDCSRVSLSLKTVTGGREAPVRVLAPPAAGWPSGAVSPRSAGSHCGPTNARRARAGALGSCGQVQPRVEVAAPGRRQRLPSCGPPGGRARRRASPNSSRACTRQLSAEVGPRRPWPPDLLLSFGWRKTSGPTGERARVGGGLWSNRAQGGWWCSGPVIPTRRTLLGSTLLISSRTQVYRRLLWNSLLTQKNWVFCTPTPTPTPDRNTSWRWLHTRACVCPPFY